ncbi:MAG: tetratricopeptide repeat protein [Pseudomonadota bacterium]|nr:tetratricopeptide repeat protein [Pseudomonadota bacterium]
MNVAALPVGFAIAAFLLTTTLAAQESVNVRGGGHSKFGRLVFDWPKKVGYDAKISGRNLIVRFDRPLRTDFDPAIGALYDYVSAAMLSSDNRTASVRLKGDFALRSFVDDNSIVIDIFRKKDVLTQTAGDAIGQTLSVRKGQHKNYDRLVFDWTRPVEYEFSRDGKIVTVGFNRLARIDVAKLRKGLGKGFSNPSTSLEGRRLIFKIGIRANSRVRHFRAGTKIVLDVFRRQKVSNSNTSKLTMRGAPVVSVTKQKSLSNVPRPPSKRPVNLVPKALSPATTQKSAQNNEIVKTAIKPGQDTSSLKDDSNSLEQVKKDTQEKTKVVKQSTLKATSSDKSRSKDAKKATKAEEEALEPVTLVFAWPEVVTLAVFRRNEYVWIIFDKRTPIQTTELLQQSNTLIERLDQVPGGQGTILRVKPKHSGINVSNIQLEENDWHIRFSESPMLPSAQISFGVNQTDTQGAQLLMPLEGEGKLITFRDPNVGDNLQVITIDKPGLGMEGERAYPEFQIFASAQGVAINPFDPDLVLNKLEDAIEFGGPEGLYVSNISPVPSKMDVASRSKHYFGPVGSQILEPLKWQRGDINRLYEVRRELFDNIIKQSPKRRAKSRTELARYNFAHGLAQEVLSIMKVIETSDLKAAAEPEFGALKGAALVLSERGEEAKKILKDSRLDEYQDISIWRGAADYLLGDIDAAAVNFSKGDPSLQNYPISLKENLLVKRMAAALDTNQIKIAQKWREAITEELDKFKPAYQARWNFILGRLYREELDFDNAIATYKIVLDSGDEWSAVRAEYELIDLHLQQETIKVSEAITRLERLRFAWRGDAFERKILNRLADLYIGKGEYRKGLNALKVIVGHFSKHKAGQKAAQKMKVIFRRLYIDGEADNISPIKALALYDEFRVLTPAGPDGNLMIGKLAERLVKVDLLDKASEVLSHQIKFRLKAKEKAAVGTKLALIRLIARDPKGALTALRDSFFPNLPVEIEDDRRRIQAKAEFELGRANDAIALLAGDVSREADQLRSAIYFRERNWGEAVKVYHRLVGDPPDKGTSFNEEIGRTALLWAVALKLNRDEEGLKQLYELYGPSMKGSPMAATFDYIARPSDDDSFDPGSIKKRISDVDQFQAFMKNYRERLLNSGKEGKKPTGSAQT